MEYKVNNPGMIIYEGGYYFDQLCGSEPNYQSYENWIFKSNMSRYLMDKYNLTQQQYYNIVVYRDINYINKCGYCECDNSTEFKTLLMGYRRGCCPEHGNLAGWQDEERRAHQAEVGKHSMEIINDNLWNSPEYEEFRNEHSERMSKMMTENNYDPEFSKKAICSGNRSYAINNYGETSIIYIWSRDSYCKIGICESIDNIYQKINSYCPDYLVAFEGKTVDTAQMEYDIKMNNTALWGNEFFDISRFDEFEQLMSQSFKEVYRTEE